MSPKVCSKCGLPEGQVRFAIELSRGKLRPRLDCVDCRKQYLRKYYASKEAYFREYRVTNKIRQNLKAVECNKRKRHERYEKIQAIKEASPCMDCEHKFPYFVMDFDHRDPATKVADVSILVKTGVRWSRVLEEIAKCDLVCVNCHRLRTYHGDDNYRSMTWKKNRRRLDELKASTPCLDCGSSFQPCQMDFDHVRGRKAATVSQLTGSTWETLFVEVRKCDLICGNCHRIRTQSRHPGRAEAASDRTRKAAA